MCAKAANIEATENSRSNSKKVSIQKKAARCRNRPMNESSPVIPESRCPFDPGRPSLYSPELRDRICNLIADGVTWREIERRKIVSQRTIAAWRHEIPEFNAAYLLAKEARGESLLEKIDGILAQLTPKCTQRKVNALRLHIDTLKWQIRTCYPKMFGYRLGDMHHPDLKERQYDWTKLEQEELLTLERLMDKACCNQEENSGT